MIRKSGNRFSEKIMLEQKEIAASATGWISGTRMAAIP
jgi:hypothetical protein